MSGTQRDLYLVRGLPGSGKSTFVDSVLRADDVACSPDDYMVDETGGYAYDKARVSETAAMCVEDVTRAMKQGVSRIFVHSIFTKHNHQREYQRLAKAYGYRVFSLIVERHHAGRSSHFASNEEEDRARGERRDRFDIEL